MHHAAVQLITNPKIVGRQSIKAKHRKYGILDNHIGIIRTALEIYLLRGHDHSPQKAEGEGRVRNLHQRGGQGQVGQS